jgi:hypothetical protein
MEAVVRRVHNDKALFWANVNVASTGRQLKLYEKYRHSTW